MTQPVEAPSTNPPDVRGSLSVVGTGLQIGQTTIEARGLIEDADKVFYLVADPLTARWIQRLNASAESLYDAYAVGKPRVDSYAEMVARILAPVRSGSRVCAVFYGHPGVFALPSHEAVYRAREEGFAARMLPGVSAEDCLFADLGLDPGNGGLQSFEATEFLLYRRTFDPCVPLVLWQISVVGEFGYRTDQAADRGGLHVLIDELVHHYGPDHEVVIYEAATLPVCGPSIEVVRLADVPTSAVSAVATLFVPAKPGRVVDQAMAARLTRDAPVESQTEAIGRTASGGPSRSEGATA